MVHLNQWGPLRHATNAGSGRLIERQKIERQKIEKPKDRTPKNQHAFTIVYQSKIIFTEIFIQYFNC